jgi:hypothetical protein
MNSALAIAGTTAHVGSRIDQKPVAILDIADPANPTVVSEIQDGTIWVVDSRNGLYSLRHTGKFEDEVTALHLAEGNSNLHFRPPGGRRKDEHPPVPSTTISACAGSWRSF